MWALALLLLQAPAAAPDDILVVAERLKRLRFSAAVDKQGRVRCKVKRSSGDRMLDAVACDAVRDCAARRLSALPAVQACLEERLHARLAALRAQDREAAGADPASHP